MHMPTLRFDSYYDYAELTLALRMLAEAYPRLMRLESIGRSFEQRDIWLATLTNATTGTAQSKPALWVDGNIHATEVAGSMACLYLIDYLVKRYGRDDEVTHCLDTRAFYVCPRVNPDGAQWALAPVPRLIRSSVRPYPYDEEPIDGLRREDVDGDGRVLSMRLRDPNGPWKASERDPRLLVRRAPEERGGEYFRLLPEGRFDQYDAGIIRLQARKEGLDLNRNFPASWRQEHEQQGAGPYPTSEPEVRALVEFVSAHANITGAVAFHTYSGVLLRPYSHHADDTLPANDLWTYQKIGAKGTELTGYPNISVFHDFRYHPKEVITGSFDDWMYEHGGVFAWTVEIWSPQREAGILDYKFIDWYREHPIEDDLKLLAWNDTVLGGRGFVDWYPFEHPQLGAVELGGWDTLYTWSNPPLAMLEREIARFPPWLVWQLAISPRLEILSLQVLPLGPETYRVRCLVHNTGWLPSYVTQRALDNKVVRGVMCEIALPEAATLEGGVHRVELSQLQGRAYKPATPSSWAGWSGDVTDDRALAEWIVRAPRGGMAAVRAWHDRAGEARGEVELCVPSSASR
jgi:murein tripeptide amidase MpaA